MGGWNDKHPDLHKLLRWHRRPIVIGPESPQPWAWISSQPGAPASTHYCHSLCELCTVTLLSMVILPYLWHAPLFAFNAPTLTSSARQAQCILQSLTQVSLPGLSITVALVTLYYNLFTTLSSHKSVNSLRSRTVPCFSASPKAPSTSAKHSNKMFLEFLSSTVAGQNKFAK